MNVTVNNVKLVILLVSISQINILIALMTHVYKEFAVDITGSLRRTDIFGVWTEILGGEMRRVMGCSLLVCRPFSLNKSYSVDIHIA